MTVSESIRRPFWFSLVAFSLACSHAPPETTPALPPAPVPQASLPGTTWRIPQWEGSASYRFSRHAVVTSDSAAEKALVFDTSGVEVFTHRATSRSNAFTLAGSTGNRAVSSASVTLIDGRLLPGAEGSTIPCDPARNQLRSDLSDLALTLPAALAAGTSWTDSVASEVCVGGTPGTARTIRHFLVIGDTAVDGERGVLVSRRDSTMIAAEGVLGQHPTMIAGTAQSAVQIYVSESSGRVLRVAKEQILSLAITAEGRTRAFAQKLTSSIELGR